MDNVIKAVYILHLDGTPILRIKLEKSTEEERGSLLDLFGGFSSAINVLVRELGHKELKSITVGDGALVYTSREPLLFVAHTVDPKYEQVAKLLIKQVEHDFLDEYRDVLEDASIYIQTNFFNPFVTKVEEVHASLMKLYREHPHLLEFLPSFIPLIRIYKLLDLGHDIIEGYPEDTIKLIRRLDQLYSNDEKLQEIVARTLGRYSGYTIAKQRFQDDFVIGQENILELLNEISVTKYDKKKEVYDIQLCPICRGKTSDRPICDFFSGFIEGALGNPSISVEEISCRALGAKTCSFKLNRE